MDPSHAAAREAWTPEDFTRLEALLHAPPLPERALTADALQGMCVAMAMGPDGEPPDDWLEVALNATPGQGEPPTPELLDLMERFRERTATALADATLEPRLYTLRRGAPDYATWCQGFLLGVEIAPTDWYDAADADEVDELLFPIRALAGALEQDARAAYTPGAWQELLQDSQADLEASLLRLRDYWTIVRTPPATVRHAQPKVGRNDPCPCGSGRKHKLCCGR